jgi:hypothetical protein
VERIKRLDDTTASLEKTYTELTAKLESDGITTEGIEAIIQFVANVSNGLAVADGDFAERRKIIELFDVTAVLKVMDGKKKVCLSKYAWG